MICSRLALRFGNAMTDRTFTLVVPLAIGRKALYKQIKGWLDVCWEKSTPTLPAAVYRVGTDIAFYCVPPKYLN